jgi:hypothetical protein
MSDGQCGDKAEIQHLLLLDTCHVVGHNDPTLNERERKDMKLPAHAIKALAADAACIKAGRKVIETRGECEASCIAYDLAGKAENAAYEVMNKKGLTREQWAEYDRQRSIMYESLREEYIQGEQGSLSWQQKARKFL